MTPQQFIAKWQRVNLSERSACQQHFLDLCELLGPAQAGRRRSRRRTWYTFERGVTQDRRRPTAGPTSGCATISAGSTSGRHKDLAAAYKQLLDYREDLENPPLLVVCDSTASRSTPTSPTRGSGSMRSTWRVLPSRPNLDILRKLFTEPDALRPDVRAEAITKDAAERFGDLAKRLRMRKGVSAQRAAHFLMKLMFCMFGERIGLLPSKLFGRLLETAKANPAMLTRKLENLFRAMAEGGDFGAEMIPHFNGGLFADHDVVPLTEPEINILASVNGSDWSNVEPSIFGTLFERHFDPSKESLVGAHYTSREDIVDAGRAGGDGAAQARVGGSPPAVRRGAVAEGARDYPHRRQERKRQGVRGPARRSTGPCRTSPSGCTTSRCSIRPVARATSSTWRSICSWTWRRR